MPSLPSWYKSRQTCRPSASTTCRRGASAIRASRQAQHSHRRLRPQGTCMGGMMPRELRMGWRNRAATWRRTKRTRTSQRATLALQRSTETRALTSRQTKRLQATKKRQMHPPPHPRQAASTSARRLAPRATKRIRMINTNRAHQAMSKAKRPRAYQLTTHQHPHPQRRTPTHARRASRAAQARNAAWMLRHLLGKTTNPNIFTIHLRMRTSCGACYI